MSNLTLTDWFGSFWKITVRPLPITFIDESLKSYDKLSSAFGWLLFISIFNHLVIYVKSEFIFPIMAIIITVFFFPLAFLFFAFCLDTVYRKLFHGNKSHYDKFLYLAVAIYIPYQILSAPLYFIPEIGDYLGWLSLVYPVVLLIIAVKSITNIRLWEATITVFISIILGFASFFCIPAFFLGIMSAVPSLF